jgi:hypothetical protein
MRRKERGGKMVTSGKPKLSVSRRILARSYIHLHKQCLEDFKNSPDLFENKYLICHKIDTFSQSDPNYIVATLALKDSEGKELPDNGDLENVLIPHSSVAYIEVLNLSKVGRTLGFSKKTKDALA